MKLLSDERKYLMKLLEKEAHHYNSPMSSMVVHMLSQPNCRESDRRYWERQQKVKANKARLVANIIGKINGCK